MSPKGNGKLLLYNAYPRNYSTFSEAIHDLKRIGKDGLGFNAVWLNPLNAASNLIVKRLNVLTYQEEEVKGSLYAARDFSRLNTDLFTDFDEEIQADVNDGNPAHYTPKEQSLLKKYTDTARENGLRPIFDLVLNHVALDSPLVTGTCKYFQDKGIDTTKWFKKNEIPRWDDIIPFNYEDPKIRQQILEQLWKPYIHKFIVNFGFMGVRLDFAEGFKYAYELEVELCKEINQLVKDAHHEQPIIFAETLPPRGVERVSREFREIFTHVTNNSLFNPEHSGHDIGTNRDDSRRSIPGGGTIGFAASHDNGPNARNALEHEALQIIYSDEFKRHIFSEANKKKQEAEEMRAISEQVHRLLQPRQSDFDEWIKTQKRRIVTCALVSDGGTYLLGGDEFGDPTPKSVFSKPDGRSIYDEAVHFAARKNSKAVDFSDLIMNLNHAISEMPRSIFPHWAKVLHLEAPYNDLVIVINYNGEAYTDPNPELTIVNLTKNPLKITDELLVKIAEKNKESSDTPEQAYHAVLRSTKRLIGAFEHNLSVDTHYYNKPISTNDKGQGLRFFSPDVSTENETHQKTHRSPGHNS